MCKVPFKDISLSVRPSALTRVYIVLLLHIANHSLLKELKSNGAFLIQPLFKISLAILKLSELFEIMYSMILKVTVSLLVQPLF